MGDNPFSFILAHTAGGTRGRSETLQQENGGANSLAPSSSHDSLSSLACETPSKASRGLLGKTSSPATGGKKPQQQQQQLLKTASFRRMDSPCASVTPQKQQTLALNRNRSSSKESKPLPFPLQYNAPSSSSGPSLARGGGGVPTSASSSRQLLPPAPAPPSACKTLNKALVAKNSLGAGLGPMNASINKALLNRQREAVRRIRNQRAEDFSAPLEASAEEVEVVRRRQSIAITTEIKNLVRAAEAEAAEGEGVGGEGAGADAEAEEEAEADVFADLPLVASPPPSPSPALLSPPAAPRISDALDGRKRESLALDSALIGKMLPRKVQLQVRQGKPVPPEFFGNVSIFFSDVVGFTNISAAVEPIQVIRLLNTLFTVMDHVTSLFPLYKVETIGDAYMVASGLPEPNPDNCQALADFAILVSAAVAVVSSPLDGSPIRIRMGMHTGDVMAGVVGTMMPRYCLFGDTVNTASRMESNGEPGRIHMSSAIASLLIAGGRHVVEERGEIEVKGKGMMRTYWLVGGAPGNDVADDASVRRVVEQSRQLVENSYAFGCD